MVCKCGTRTFNKAVRFRYTDDRKVGGIMKNSLTEMKPELVIEWSQKNLPITPDNVPFGSNKIYWWKGKCGHEWQTSVKARSHGENCPICSNARIIHGINDLATLAPEVAEQWSEKNLPLLPTMVGVGSHKKAIWKGKCGHEWAAPIRDRVQGDDCPYCTHRAILPGFNDLETVFPEIAKEWSERNYSLLPSQVAPFANRRVWWKCEHGHEWYTLISTRSGGSKCPYCTDIKVLPGYNDFATRYPALAKEWSDKNFPLSPDSISVKSTKNVWWKCQTCGHEWKAVISSRAKGLKCPVCAERAVKEGYNDLATTDALLLAEWDYEKNTDIMPTQISRNSMRYVWWKCAFGHSRRDRISNRTIEHKRCPSCEADFDAVLPQLLVSYYAKQNHVKVVLNDETMLGTQLDAYIPELKLAFGFPYKHTRLEDGIGGVVEHLCKQRCIQYVRIVCGQEREAVCAEIRKGFGKAHIFIASDGSKDIRRVYEKFFEWRKRD